MKIPEYDQRVSLPAPGPEPSISPEAAAAPWLGLSRVGGAVYELGKTIQERQDEIARVNDITNRSIRAENDISDLKLAIEKERDPQTATQRFSEGIAEIKNRTMDGVEDYKVANALTSHLANREISGVTEVKHEAYKWTLENDQMDMMRQNDELTKLAIKEPDKIDYFAQKKAERVWASVATGSIRPETGRLLIEKETKDLYRQVMSQMILASPMAAPEMIEPLLAKSGMDPADMLSMRTSAEAARTRAERDALRGDKVQWESTAAQASMMVRSGTMNESGVNELYSTGMIGPDQLQHLQSVLDSSKTRSTSDNLKTSEAAMYEAMNQVFFFGKSPDAVLHRINGNPNILPQHKSHAAQTLLSFARGGDKIPSQMEKAMQIYRTKVAPSSFSLNARSDEMEALGAVMREVYTDYFANEQRYKTDPDLLIKRAIEKTKPENLVGDGIPNNPWKDKDELLEAYNIYVLGKISGYVTEKIESSRVGNKDIPREWWQKWFTQSGGTMPPWPE